jgi:small nuclear ribonucleoprotein (snRNP)-like protein
MLRRNENAYTIFCSGNTDVRAHLHEVDAGNNTTETDVKETREVEVDWIRVSSERPLQWRTLENMIISRRVGSLRDR